MGPFFLLSRHVNSSSRKGHFVETLEPYLQLHKNDLKALKEVPLKTTDGVLTAVDPEFKTPMTTCGKNKLSFDKTVVDKQTTDGGKATPPYSDLQQVLVCRSSQYNVQGLHQEQDDVARTRSFQQETISRALYRMTVHQGRGGRQGAEPGGVSRQ